MKFSFAPYQIRAFEQWDFNFIRNGGIKYSLSHKLVSVSFSKDIYIYIYINPQDSISENIGYDTSVSLCRHPDLGIKP